VVARLELVLELDVADRLASGSAFTTAAYIVFRARDSASSISPSSFARMRACASVTARSGRTASWIASAYRRLVASSLRWYAS
jgi:hypothetical protein